MATKTRRHSHSRSTVSPILAPKIPSRESKDELIAFRVPARWKANIEKRLNELGVPASKRADFYRGAVIAGIGNALRAQDSKWQAFVDAIQPLAKKHLSMELSDDGAESILSLGQED